jgi:hypothetical protein
MLACIGCQWHLRPSENVHEDTDIVIERYDRIERLYLTTADFAALQQMKTLYPRQTRTLIEDVLRLGRVDEPDINTRFLLFFQDSTLQVLIRDVERQYAEMDDLNQELTSAFTSLRRLLPDLPLPMVYAQIGSLDQSIIVGDSLLGISLDKYLGSDHPLYLRYGYSEQQRSMMTRQYIVPDCLGFYLLSLYPIPSEETRDEHMANIQYVVNRVMGRRIFTRDSVVMVEHWMKEHPRVTVEELLSFAPTGLNLK